MIKTSILSSGSKGNAIYFETASTSILIDNGLSLKKLNNCLAEIDRNSDNLSAVFVSHEHSDHIKGVELLARKKKVPVYITKKTCDKLNIFSSEKHSVNYFQRGDSIQINDLRIETFPTEHDAVDSCGFILSNNGYSIGLATDLGKATNLVSYKLSQVNHLMVEANHEPELLMQSSYPWHVKQRIKSDKGHLSNQDCFSLIEKVMHDNVHHVSFMHLSEENNNADLLRQMAKDKLARYNVDFTVGKQDVPSALI